MNFLKSLSSRIRRRRHHAYNELPPGHRSVGKILLDVVLFPIRALFLPFKALGIFHDTGVEVDEHDKSFSLKKRLGRFGKTVVLLPLRILQAPFKLFQALRTAQRTDILFVLPALVVTGFFAFVFLQVFWRGDAIESRYRIGVKDAIDAGDFELAKTYYQRILASEELKPPQKYQWAKILARTGEEQRAEQLFQELAPDDEIGFGPAHRIKAISIALQLGQTKDPGVLRKLRWHLQNSRDESPEIQQAWATYYLATEQFDDAIKALDKAAEADPTYYLMISTIYKSKGRNADSRIALEKAEKSIRKIFEKDQLDHQVRIALANVLARLEKYSDAEELLKQGVRIQPDALIMRSMSDFYVMRHDLALTNQEDTATQMQFLVQAIEFDPNYSPVYSRMMTMFLDANKSPENAAQVKKTFMDIVTSDHPTPLAHFALSNVLWQEGEREKAQFHLEQAYTLNNKIVVVLNNLAWMLAHSENPDLARALELSQIAVEQEPNDTRFRDTLGTVYFKMERFKEAVTELQRALPGVSDKKEVHQKLSICYQHLNMDDLARIHAEKAK